MITLKAWKNSHPVGTLNYNGDTYTFTYFDDVTEAHAISLTMPITERVYETQTLHPVFQQNLPEGMLADALRKHFGKLIDLSDDIGMLRFTGKFKTGYLQVTEIDEEPDSALWESLESIIDNTDGDSLDLFHECVKKFGSASGLSGVQPKVAANLISAKKDKRSTLKTDSYILKFHDEREYFGLTVNEYFSLKAAEYAKISTASSEIIENANCLLVHRFDEKKDDNFYCMEDFCALQTLNPQGRYRGDYLDLVQVVHDFVPPSKKEKVLLSLFQNVAFSMKIFNGDAHLKNFALMYDSDGIQMAPAYDQVCTTAYLPKDIPALSFLRKKKWPEDSELIEYAMACELGEEQAMEVLGNIEQGKRQALIELEEYCSAYERFEPVYESIQKNWQL